MEEIRILQLGDEDWNIVYTLPQWVRLDYAEHLDESPGKKEAGRPYDLCFLDRTPREEEMVSLYEMAKVYALFITENVETGGRLEKLCRRKKAQRIESAKIQKKQDTTFRSPMVKNSI